MFFAHEFLIPGYIADTSSGAWYERIRFCPSDGDSVAMNTVIYMDGWYEAGL